LGGKYQANRWRARTVGVERHDRGELPIGQHRRRRHQHRVRRVADAHYAQDAVAAGVILLPRRRRAIVVGVGVTHADTVEHIGGLRLRHMRERHDEQDLAPCTEQQCGKANGTYPSG
jgi:hypothetical protein